MAKNEMKWYEVTYISAYGMYEIYRTDARNKREARNYCKENLGTLVDKIEEIEEINW